MLFSFKCIALVQCVTIVAAQGTGDMCFTTLGLFLFLRYSGGDTGSKAAADTGLSGLSFRGHCIFSFRGSILNVPIHWVCDYSYLPLYK